jgi:DNA polymerase type B, organellar and viral
LGSLRAIIKLLLNSLLGRFGLNIFKPITKTVDMSTRDFIASTRTIKAQKELNDSKYLITYDPNISETICKEHGLDYLKVLNKESNANLEKQLISSNDISIATAAMVTSYARIFINKIKLEVLKNGGNIYYSDTDSLILDNTYFNAN